MTSQREQYRGTVHLFIGTGRSPCKNTLMPFTFANDSIVIHRSLNSLRLVPFSDITPKVPYAQLRLCANLRILCTSSHCGSDPSPKVHVHTMHRTPKTLLNHVFEDLRKTKAPNSTRSARYLEMTRMKGK